MRKISYIVFIIFFIRCSSNVVIYRDMEYMSYPITSPDPYEIEFPWWYIGEKGWRDEIKELVLKKNVQIEEFLSLVDYFESQERIDEIDYMTFAVIYENRIDNSKDTLYFNRDLNLGFLTSSAYYFKDEKQLFLKFLEKNNFDLSTPLLLE
ncbi:hypothetical protein [Aureivirga sp. CE67]|uniref:hypothetical protein n=1 Tax=Aureivirga sp. CE67 TaxID=1788983 RepID=UPI0018CB405F|nr:hypothetical protein [Aureivirga sp. CE67]